MIEEVPAVQVPPTGSPLQPEVLQALVDPTSECDDLGASFYAITKQFVELCCTYA